MRRTILSLALPFLFTLACATSTRTGSQTAATNPGGSAPAGMENCPAAVPGTSVAEADTNDGAAITFTTSSDRVDDLRSRVEGMADMINRHGAGGEMSGTGSNGGTDWGEESTVGEAWSGSGNETGGTRGIESPDQVEKDEAGGQPGSAGSMQGMHGMMPRSQANVQEVENGARLLLTPKDPADAERLRNAARQHASMMQQGRCG